MRPPMVRSLNPEADLTRNCCKCYGLHHKLSGLGATVRALTAPTEHGMRWHMIFLGVALIIIGLIASIPVLWAIGVILLIVGIAVELMGMAGHAVGGRRHYY